MNTTTSTTPTLESDEPNRLVNQFVVCQAAELARSGSYSSAESLLNELIQQPTAPAEALDLQARICAQQGRLGEAAHLWTKALEKDPGNTAYQAALGRIYRMQRRPVWITILWPAALAALVIVLCIAAYQFQFHRQASEVSRLGDVFKQTAATQAKAAEAALAAVSAQIITVQTNQAVLATQQARIFEQAAETQAGIPRLEQQLGELTAQLTKLEQVLATSGNAVQTPALKSAEDSRRNERQQSEGVVTISSNLPGNARADTTPNTTPTFQWPKLEVMGIRQTVEGTKLRVIFDEGLFFHGTHFKLGAKERLVAAIKALAQSKEQFVVEVIGYSDGDQDFFGPPDSYSLGLKRAATVVGLIRSSALFSPSQLRASSGGSAQLPFTSGTEASRSRNRTVVLQISRDEK